MSDPDEPKPWTIRGVTPEMRNAIKQAAAKAARMDRERAEACFALLRFLADHPAPIEGSVLADITGCSFSDIIFLEERGLIDFGLGRVAKNFTYPFITRDGRLMLEGLPK
jgi:hypothetical protein